MDPSHLPFTHDGTISKRSEASPIECRIRYNSLSKPDDRGVPGTPGVEGFFVVNQKGQDEKIDPLSMGFMAPCVTLFTAPFQSSILSQLHFNVPIAPGKVRLIFFQSTRFKMFKLLPNFLNEHFVNQVVDQDTEMLISQQANVNYRSRPWHSTVPADGLGVKFRKWQQQQEKKGSIWFEGYDKLLDIEDLLTDPEKSPKDRQIIHTSGGKDFHPLLKAPPLFQWPSLPTVVSFFCIMTVSYLAYSHHKKT